MRIHRSQAVARMALFAGAAVALAAPLAGCSDDRSGVPATNVADHRVGQVAATATVPGVCAPKPARPATVVASGGASVAPMPAQPGSCTK